MKGGYGSKWMIDTTHCYALCFNENFNIDFKIFKKMTWKSFLNRNKKQRLKGSWFFDDWLLDKIRQFAKLMGYRLTYDVSVFIRDEIFPLIVKFNTFDMDKNFYVLIAPREVNEE